MPLQWFLPHFPVVQKDRATTKVKIIFDSAAKFKERSWNDMMHSGPKVQQDLVNVLICLRRHPVALVGDISEMFSQLDWQRKIHPTTFQDSNSKEKDSKPSSILFFYNKHLS